MNDAQLFRATFFHTTGNPFREAGALQSVGDGGILVRNGRIVASGGFDEIRRAAPAAEVVDWRGGVLLPGFVDTHVHYPQIPVIGAMDLELLDWLAQRTLPEEAKMADPSHAHRAAQRFVRLLAGNGTTSALVFGSHFPDAQEALFDAAERLLVEVGYAGIEARRLAEEAGVNHGLVHYYFGSIDELFVQVLERFTDRLVARQREMYAADVPFIEKWRTAWRFQEQDLEAGYSKIWMELQALSWSQPELRPRVARVTGEWRAVLRDAIQQAATEYDLDPEQFPVEALVAMTMTFGQGYALDRLEGIDEGHQELLAWIERWLESLDARRRKA